MEKGTQVKIKGYKKIHTIDGVYLMTPPKEIEKIIYHLKGTPPNKMYFKMDLIKVN